LDVKVGFGGDTFTHHPSPCPGVLEIKTSGDGVDVENIFGKV
jgi:hypothetical protein